MYRLAGAAIGALLPLAAHAAPTIDPQYGDHAVIQRGQPITITGSADPGEQLSVTLGDEHATAIAGTDGRFAATLAPLAAGGPLTLSVAAPSGRASASDILIGDVFLCSGQSNMELQVARAQDSWNQVQNSADSQLRLMTIDKVTAVRPQTAFAHPPRWKVAGPDSVADFSAACYYMVQTLRKSAKVPVGAIASSWGGTQISAWMGDRALIAAGRGADAAALALYARDPAAAARQSGAIWETWWRQQTGDQPGHEPWQPDAQLDWRTVPKISGWEQWGVPELADHVGMVWFRHEVTLTPEQAKQGATLEIGAVDDMDRTWVNGIAAGAGGNPGAPRHYPLASGTLHAGRNLIIVNADNVYADGGMLGPADVMRLAFADGSAIPLGTGWQYAIAKRTPDNPPRAPWQQDDAAVAAAAPAPQTSAPNTRVAAAAPASQPQSEGFFSSLARKVGIGGATADTTATTTPPPPQPAAKPKLAEAKPRPKAFKPVESKPTEVRQAARPPLKPSVTGAPATAAAAAPPKNDLVAGAQPIVQSNSFDSRFSAMK